MNLKGTVFHALLVDGPQDVCEGERTQEFLVVAANCARATLYTRLKLLRERSTYLGEEDAAKSAQDDTTVAGDFCVFASGGFFGESCG